MSRAWRLQLLRLVLWAAFGALVATPFDAPLIGVVVALSLFGLIQIRHLIQLRNWLQRPKRYELPEPSGLWGEVFDALLDMQRKNRKKKKKLGAILAEFQASTAALPDGAVVLGERGEISWFNTAARTLLGLRVPHDYGIRVPNLIRHPAFTEYFDAGRFDGAEVEVPSPVNRGKSLALRIIPYGNNQRLLIVRDISERQMLEAARRDFVANASHELRTPLTVLRGYLDMMDMDAQAHGPLAQWASPVAEMRNQALRMESLVNDMLKLARLESGKAQGDERINAPNLILRAIDEAKALSKGQHRFEVEVDEQLTVVGPEAVLHSIVQNLLTNAVRYTPAGGVIRASWQETAEGARFAVADTGIGISPEDLPRLTERFYRVDVGRSRASGGTGLGLSIVKHALEAFDSHLDVESEIGVGSTFFCVFPPHRVQRLPATEAAGAE